MKLVKDRKGTNMVGFVTAVITAVIVISIAVIITNELITSQYTTFGINVSDPTDAASATDMQGGFNATRSLAGAGLTVLPVVILVLAAVPVIAGVYLLGRT